ncbi:UDP-N-acetylglucosamine--dolichyl-phosphate N-acetylglucosaminyltransferase [uncultured archaeon]|nr:UDP-N-acetylglucosamine--dolichyl-phosphate N-acetylglucosaminyltransferase [uncultured archaeon]
MKKTAHQRTLAVIPCCNEEVTVANVILKTKRFVNEVVVIDDGSTDETKKIAKEAGATVIAHRKNRGKGAAIRTGFKYALDNDFDYVVTIDGDGQHNPLEIPALLDNVINNGNDISIGYRVGNNTEMPMWRRVGKRVLDYTTSMGTGGFVTDSQCGFRAFNKKAVKAIAPKLRGDAFSVESEQLIKAHESGLKVVNTNVTCKYKNLDTSKKNPASHGLSVLGYIIWVIAERRPLLFITLPGFLSVLSGFFLGLATFLYPQYNFITKTTNTIITSILIIIGAFAMFTGLLLHVLPRLLKRLD